MSSTSLGMLHSNLKLSEFQLVAARCHGYRGRGGCAVDAVNRRLHGTREGKGRCLGFSLFMMKAVINGRGSEVIDLLKTNLF